MMFQHTYFVADNYSLINISHYYSVPEWTTCQSQKQHQPWLICAGLRFISTTEVECRRPKCSPGAGTCISHLHSRYFPFVFLTMQMTVLCDLHWHCVMAQTRFKTALPAYKAEYGLVHLYLQAMVNFVQQPDSSDPVPVWSYSTVSPTSPQTSLQPRPCLCCEGATCY